MSKYSTYILYLLITILVVILYVNDFTPLAGMQRSVNDLLCRVTASSTPPPNIQLVMIDARAQTEFGQWPWNHDRIADLLAAAASGEPKAVVLDVELSEEARQDSAGYTQILADQLSWVPNTILPYDIALSNFRGNKTSNPKYLFKNSVNVDNKVGLLSEEASLNARKVFLPAEKLLSHDPYLGFNYTAPDNDRILRHQPMIMNYEGFYYPSLPLMAAAVYLGMTPDKIKVGDDGQIHLGTQRTIPVSDQGEFFISFTKDNPFVRHSAADVLGEKFNYSQFKNKLIVIGVSTPDQNETFVTPVGNDATELAVKASVMDNIINNRILMVQNRRPGIDLLVLFLLGGVCAFILPRVALMYRMVILGAGLVILANVNYFMLASFNTMPQTMYVMLQLVLFAFASPLLESTLLAGESAATYTDRKKVPKVHTEKARGQAAGSADEVKVRELKVSPADPDNLVTTAVDMGDSGRHAQRTTALADGLTDSSKTASPSEPLEVGDMSDISGGHGQSQSGATASSSEGLGFSDSSSDGWKDSSGAGIKRDSGELSLPGDQSDLKNLGRYQIMGTLGRGAMGMVYRGIDPAINRPVALKTIRLDFVNDPDEFAELKERLYREAQAAGKLSHPNIVTIYDVGSEGPLQYIAMEYLEGVTLEHLIKKKTRFNYKIIAQIITQICAALEYAHERGIVHRDIKPANVMVLSDYRVKVMDFGIARIDSNSMTKTGIAMGTPNYISPEQLRGLPIDRRADLFSLGVLMYEMLLGRRPFKGENITSLIYAIMHHEPDKPSNLNPQIPLLFDHVIAKALKKNPQERYQKASEITTDLHDFVESFAKS
ncbi:MAG: serine/threonine-protein kinase [Candidatus Zixiibacteriota bacterium]